MRGLEGRRADALDLAPGDLNAEVAEAARLARPRAEELGIAVELDLAADLPPVALSVPALLQVLRNLTTNALQAMPGGGVLRLSTLAVPGRRRVAVRVADTGPGLTAEVRAHVFEPFFTTRPAGAGAGLGLALSRQIVSGHGGSIDVESRLGEGACFRVRLPLRAAAPAPEPAP